MHIKHAIKIRNLTKKFRKFTAVNKISLDVKEGEIFAFLGPNGAGKTTTIKIMTTLLQPTSGEVRLNGIDPVRDQDGARKTFGIVFQDPSLDDELTAYENLFFHGVLYDVPKDALEKRIEEMLRLVELWDRKNDLVKQFSGGMKRRLEIARGFLHQPKILFLDEPTLGLDPQTRNLLWEFITRLNKKMKLTVFFTTHYMEEADKIADRIAIIDAGKIVSQGTPAELKAKTKTKNLEDAFIKLTGKVIREEESTAQDQMRTLRKLWGRR